MSNTPKRSQGSGASGSEPDHLTPIDVQFRRDDRYYNLLYRNYNRNSLNVNGESSGPRNEEASRDARKAARELARQSALAACKRTLVVANRICRQRRLLRAARDATNDSNPTPDPVPDLNRRPRHVRVFGSSNVYPACVPLGRNTADIERVRQRVGTLHEAPPLLPYPCRSTSPQPASAPERSASLGSIAVKPSLPRVTATPKRSVEQLINDDKNKVLEAYKCPVCLKYVSQRKPMATTCGHVFCSCCIKAALDATYKCPVCQSWMTKHEVFRVYI